MSPSPPDHEAILGALRDNRARRTEERDRHNDAVSNLRDELYDLLARGRAEGVPLRAISKASQIARPRLSRMLDRMARGEHPLTELERTQSARR